MTPKRLDSTRNGDADRQEADSLVRERERVAGGLDEQLDDGADDRHLADSLEGERRGATCGLEGDLHGLVGHESTDDDEQGSGELVHERSLISGTGCAMYIIANNTHFVNSNVLKEKP